MTDLAQWCESMMHDALDRSRRWWDRQPGDNVGEDVDADQKPCGYFCRIETGDWNDEPYPDGTLQLPCIVMGGNGHGRHKHEPIALFFAVQT